MGVSVDCISEAPVGAWLIRLRAGSQVIGELLRSLAGGHPLGVLTELPAGGGAPIALPASGGADVPVADGCGGPLHRPNEGWW